MNILILKIIIILTKEKSNEIKEIKNSIKEIKEKILEIENDFIEMKYKFIYKFTNLIKEYKNVYKGILESFNKKISIYNPINKILWKYSIENIIENIFYIHFISFYDEYSSRINYKIRNSNLISSSNLFKLNNKIFNSLKSFKNEKNINLLKKYKYYSFIFFIEKLEEIFSIKMNIKIVFIRRILYNNINNIYFFHFIDLWRKYKINFEYINNKIEYYKDILKLDIMKEYNNSNNKDDERFKWLKNMLKKYKSYENIPNNINNCCLLIPNRFKTQGKLEIHSKYFEYISYSFIINNFEKKYIFSIKKYNEILKDYNNKINQLIN